MKCPKCGSEDTMTKKMAYHAHTTTGISEGSNAGVSIPVGGSPTISAGSNHGKSQTKTGIAKLAAPPQEPPEWGKVLLGYLVLVGIFAAVLFGLGLPGWIVSPIVFIGAGLFAFVIVNGHELQMDKYYEQYRAWEETWMCLRDGHQWLDNIAQ